MMVGGPPKAVKRLAPILDVLAPADQRAEPRGDRPARLAALRPLRRGALREDGPQRRRVRADAGLRRGLRPVRQVRVRARQRQDRPPLGPGLGGALVAVRTRRPRVRSRRQRPRSDRGLHRGLRRGPLDDRGRDRPRRAHARDHRLAVRALALARQRRLRRPRAGGAAQPVRRPRGQERTRHDRGAASKAAARGRGAERGRRRRPADADPRSPRTR